MSLSLVALMFTVFLDMNKDGCLQWKDFEMAKTVGVHAHAVVL